MLLTGFARPHPSRLLLIADLKEIRLSRIVYERREIAARRRTRRSRNACCCLQCRGSGRAARTAHDEVILRSLRIESFRHFYGHGNDNDWRATILHGRYRTRYR